MDTTENDGAGIEDDVLEPFVFRKPVTVAGTTYSQLKFRAPTGRDLRKVGFLFRGTNAGEFSPNVDACLKMAAMVSDPPVLPAVVDSLSGPDAQALALHIAGFFGEEG